MSDVGLLATQLANTTKCGQDLDNALLRLKGERKNANASEYSQAVDIAKWVLSDFLAIINGKLPQQYQLREETTEILRQLHRTDWQDFSAKLNAMRLQLDKTDETLKSEQLHCLEDLARAIDTECSMLFQRMQGRHR